MSIYIDRNSDDGAMCNLYSVRDGKRILWAVVHEDFLGEFEETLNIDECEQEITIARNYKFSTEAA